MNIRAKGHSNRTRRVALLIAPVIASSILLSQTGTTATASTDGAATCKTSGGLTYRVGVDSWYLSAYSPRPEDEAMEVAFGDGTSFYSTVWPLFDAPVANSQVGLASTWISANLLQNQAAKNLTGAAKDASIQTIEGSLGWWGDTPYRVALPKFEPGVTASNYSTGARDFWAGQPLKEGQGGWITLSNQILLPPDGMSFDSTSSGAQLGQTWLSLPFPKTGSQLTPQAGTNAWTLFLNSSNFKGPLAYVEPNYWTQSAAKYPELKGMTLDSQKELSYVLSGEFAGVPICEAKDANGNTYSRIPQMQFQTDSDGKFIFARDYRAYGVAAINSPMADSIKNNSTLPTTLDANGVQIRHLIPTGNDVYQGGAEVPYLKDLLTLQTFDNNQAVGFNLQSKNSMVKLPSYFVQKGVVREAAPATEAPAALQTKDWSPAPTVREKVYQVLPWYLSAGKAASTDLKTDLNDGSTVTYRWYKFVDQPMLARYNLTEDEKAKMQALVEKMQREWASNPLQAAPSGGTLAKFDQGLLVKPPAGMEYGYVPIVVRQEDTVIAAANAAKATPTPTPKPSATPTASATPTPTSSPSVKPSPTKAPAKKITITCVRGKNSKKITAFKPKCPSGWKKR